MSAHTVIAMREEVRQTLAPEVEPDLAAKSGVLAVYDGGSGRSFQQGE